MDGAEIHPHMYSLLLQCHDANTGQRVFSKIALTWPADGARFVRHLSERRPERDVWMPSAAKQASFFPATCKAIKDEDGDATSGTESL